MSKSRKFYLDFEEVFKLEGLSHVYATDLNNIVVECNDLQIEVVKETLGINRKDIIGESLLELFKTLGNLNEVLSTENELVIKSQRSHQFHNIWLVDDQCKIEFLTTKMPFYKANGDIAGVFGISQYINKFSSKRALELGLSKRETECLFYLLEGKSNKQVAKILNLSVRTVEEYYGNLRDKLCCSSKSELIVKALKTKLIDGMQENFNLLNKKIVASRLINKTGKIFGSSILS